jgi:hypothetical protein
MVILENTDLTKLFENFIGNIEYVTKYFAQTFDDECAQVGNLTIHLSENSLSQILGLPQTSDKWFENKPIDLKSCTPFLIRNR